MSETATFRSIQTSDLPTLADMENRANLWTDPDFGIEVVSPRAWNEADIAHVLSEPETRGWAIEEGQGNLVAYCLWEPEDDGYRIRRLLVHPDYRKCNFGRTILGKLYRKCVRSQTRKTLRALVNLEDRAACEWLRRMTFSSKLIRRDSDDVEFSFVTTRQAEDEPCDLPADLS